MPELPIFSALLRGSGASNPFAPVRIGLDP